MSQQLTVPQAKTSFTKQSVNDIMNAYNSQSKIQLYDDSSASTGNGLDGVKGRDIPLSALRPKEPQSYDNEGRPVFSVSKSRVAQDAQAAQDIMKAYNRMRGVDEANEGEEMLNLPSTTARRGRDLSGVVRREAEYMEDMPDDDEGLLDVLALAIKNAKANLEMLMSLYAALSGETDKDDDPYDDADEDVPLIPEDED